MLKTNKKKIKKKKTMKNDILLFAVMFAVAWIGFGALKGHLQLPATDNTLPAATSPESANLIAEPNKTDAVKPSESPNVQQASTQLEKTKPTEGSASKTAQVNTDADVDADADAKTKTVAGSDNSLSSEEAIEQVLMDQMEAWNQGDLDGFMEAYWNDENLTFSGGGGTTVGFEDTYANYRDRYPEGQMGQIKFKDLKTEMVGKESAIVTGRFDHQLPDEDVQGNFSLVLKSFDGQWKIIHDHTSVAK